MHTKSGAIARPVSRPQHTVADAPVSVKIARASEEQDLRWPTRRTESLDFVHESVAQELQGIAAFAGCLGPCCSRHLRRKAAWKRLRAALLALGRKVQQQVATAHG